MTVPVNEPFTTLQELGVWVTGDPNGIPDDRRLFAEFVLTATAITIRHYGDANWSAATIPPRAKLIADLKAKNFYEHPTGAISETTGPISERFLDEVVQQLVYSDDEKALLASLAGETAADGALQVSGLWTLSTTRGPLETHPQRAGVITHPYWREGSQPIPYYVPGDIGEPLQ